VRLFVSVSVPLVTAVVAAAGRRVFGVRVCFAAVVVVVLEKTLGEGWPRGGVERSVDHYSSSRVPRPY
jgi:hypothetical protein